MGFVVDDDEWLADDECSDRPFVKKRKTAKRNKSANLASKSPKVDRQSNDESEVGGMQPNQVISKEHENPSGENSASGEAQRVENQSANKNG